MRGIVTESRCPLPGRHQEIRASDVSLLPIVASYVKKLGIVEEVNGVVPF